MLQFFIVGGYDVCAPGSCSAAPAPPCAVYRLKVLDLSWDGCRVGHPMACGQCEEFLFWKLLVGKYMAVT